MHIRKVNVISYQSKLIMHPESTDDLSGIFTSNNLNVVLSKDPLPKISIWLVLSLVSNTTMSQNLKSIGRAKPLTVTRKYISMSGDLVAQRYDFALTQSRSWFNIHPDHEIIVH
jgi:hypothetical protein